MGNRFSTSYFSVKYTEEVRDSSGFLPCFFTLDTERQSPWQH